MEPLCWAAENGKKGSRCGQGLAAPPVGYTWLSWDSAVPLLGVQPRGRSTIHAKTCTQTFTAALLTTAKKCKQPKCPSTDGGYTEWFPPHTGTSLGHEEG